MTLADDLVLLAGAPGRDELLAAGDVGDDVLAGAPLPRSPYAAIRARAGATRGDRTVLTLVPSARAELVQALSAGLRRPSALPLRLGVLAALASAGGIAADALPGPAREAAEDVAAGVVQLVHDPEGVIPALADGLREALAALA